MNAWRMAVVVLCWVPAAMAGNTPPASTPKLWTDFNYVSICRTNDRGTLSATISVTPSDMLVDFWKDEIQREKAGSLIMTRDRFFAVSGIELDTPNEFPPLKNALVNYTLIMRLLSRASPNGPPSIVGKTDVRVQEPKKDLVIPIPGTTFRLAAPWQVEGQISPSGANRFVYSLVIVTGIKKSGDQTIRISGAVEYKADLAADLPDSFSLSRWKSYEIRRVIEVHLGEQAVNYWAHVLPDAPTLGDLRKRADQKP